MALSVSFEDVRPFLWYNYHSSNPKEKFFVDLRYTSYLNISELKACRNEEESLIFKNIETLRQRHIRKARKSDVKVVEELEIESFLQFYKSLMKSQAINVSEKKIANMRNIIKNIVETKNGTMVVAKNSCNDIIYIIVFSYDKYRAYYLFGAGNPEAKENYKGTICFWEGFKILTNKYGINEIDLEGINSPQRGWFKLSFGGDIRPYYEVKLG
jgi:lipid II:glycine glycyltransferase (peptidoglycan interpeptide bridge formation enzyme)